MATGSRTAKIELKTSAAGMDPGLKEAKRKLRAFERETAKANKAAKRDADKVKADTAKAFGHANRAAGKAIGVVGGTFAALGAAAFVSDVFDVEKELTRLSIDAGMSSAEVAAFRQNLMDTSEATGVARLELVKGAHAYQTITGDAKGATQSIGLFGEVANASGASMDDIAATAASMKQNLGIDPADFRKGFDVMITMGHKGAIELRDLAAQMSGLAPEFKDFGDKSPSDKLAEMAASAQVIRNNFGDAAQTATGFRSLMTAITKKYAALEGYGVKVFNVDPKTKKLVKRDFLDIVGDIIKNPKLNEKILPKLLGRQEAVRTLLAFRDHWGEVNSLINESTNSNQTAVDNQKYLESSSGRIAKAWEHIKNAIAEALTPERIEAFASAVERIAKFMGDAAAFFDHMLGGGKEGVQNETSRKLAEQAINGDAGEHARLVNLAKAAVANPTGPEAERLAHVTTGNQAPSNEQIAAAVSGAKDFLKSEAFQPGQAKYMVSNAKKFIAGGGVDMSQWGGPLAYSEGEQVQRKVAMGNANVPLAGKQLAMALAEALKGVTIVVKANGNAIAETGANAHVHTTRPGGRR